MVPDAFSVVCVFDHVLPVHHWPLLERWICTRFALTPELPSAAVPQRPSGLQPAFQVVEELYAPPFAGNVIVCVGAVRSTRIWVPAVLAVSAFPAASTEK